MSDSYNERRFGKFSITREYLQDNLAQYIYAGTIPVRVDADYVTDNLLVVAAHDCFAVVPAGGDAPWYDFELKFETVEHTDITGAVIGGHSEFRGIIWTKREK